MTAELVTILSLSIGLITVISSVVGFLRDTTIKKITNQLSNLPNPKLSFPYQIDTLKLNIMTSLRQIFVYLTTLIFDLTFIIIWIATQYITDRVFDAIRISQIDNFVFLVFRIVFGISTLIPIVIYIISDITRIYRRSHSNHKKQ